MSEQELKEAVKVLKKESESIDRAATRLGKNFSQALDILFNPENKIIVCGIGKSGLLGKKLAATFCSTGSPASFLHASEAVHGDLGIHQIGDPVIFLSNSASTPELLFLEPIFRKRKGKIVGIMGNADGPLIKKVDVFLNSSVLAEADPLGIVPTASFMVSAALGDALASGLMKRKKFTKSEYARTHPAGQLGRNLLFNVNDVMHPLNEIALVCSDTLISDLIVEMTKHPLGAACVVREGKLQGIITDGDLRRSLMENKNLLNMTAKQIMNAEPKMINPSLSLGEALSVMEEGSKQISVLPVAEPGQDKLMGLLRLHDIYSTGQK